MTEPTDETTDETTSASNDKLERDDVLQVLAAAAADGGFQMDLTLSCRGSLVTGTLVSQKTFWDSMAIDPKYAPLAGVAEQFGEMIPEPPEDGHNPDEFGLLHMRNARYLTGAGFAPALTTDGFFWRGRISEVSGWSFGTIGSVQTS